MNETLKDSATALYRAPRVHERDYCECCSEYIRDDQAMYNFDIGGGQGALCNICARQMIKDGDAFVVAAR